MTARSMAAGAERIRTTNPMPGRTSRSGPARPPESMADPLSAKAYAVGLRAAFAVVLSVLGLGSAIG